MRRRSPFLVAILCIAFLSALWILGTFFRHGSSRSTFGNEVRSALTNPVEYAKGHVTGGVGVLLRMESSNGLPIIQGVGAGSPAERAGLRVGDLVTQVNGQPTSGLTLKQVVDGFRGITGGNVSVKVKRDNTNLTFIISRASWNRVIKSTFVQGAGTNTQSPASTNN